MRPAGECLVGPRLVVRHELGHDHVGLVVVDDGHLDVAELLLALEEDDRAIGDVGTDNQGVNFDLANLILYGKANPVDAIELLGPYVQGIHAKDGLWPTNPMKLGQEVSIGKGKVDFPRIINRLKKLNYRGAVTIEREISGPKQVEDVRAAKVYLEKLSG